ncbi:hypothetical protein OHB26_24705 [Nocardia sp. NBC_01503]|uniref:hypothetical protein n=1 Tax=Nocardia sp. NBC_01503 TaxID=2975997 RepID=UPI002E7ABBE9|nr:hypothetical protein [Nocardia sp. NBC_01503]WTL30141.1 hypothetical protein OHB26_24705 [Nocardia sp. NBC_01503]
MAEDKRPVLWVIDSAGGECRLDVDQSIEALDQFGASPDRIARWGKRTPLDLWTMSAPELCAVLDTMLNPERSPGEVDR